MIQLYLTNKTNKNSTKPVSKKFVHKLKKNVVKKLYLICFCQILKQKIYQFFFNNFGAAYITYFKDKNNNF